VSKIERYPSDPTVLDVLVARGVHAAGHKAVRDLWPEGGPWTGEGELEQAVPVTVVLAALLERHRALLDVLKVERSRSRAAVIRVEALVDAAQTVLADLPAQAERGEFPDQPDAAVVCRLGQVPPGWMFRDGWEEPDVWHLRTDDDRSYEGSWVEARPADARDLLLSTEETG
jgi:hypothetical protein